MDKTANNAREIFSSRLREIRKGAGYKSARALAQELHIDENRYTRYERAEVEPNLQLIVQICGKLQTSPNELLGFDSGAGLMAAPGFGEASDQTSFEATPPASFHHRRRGERAAPSVDATYWHVAEYVADLALAGVSGPGAELKRLSVASQAFSKIKADPFAYATDVVNEPHVKSASADAQNMLAERLSQAITATLRAEA